MKFLAFASSVLSMVAASDVALYWGQSSAGSEQSLADYCQNSAGDIYIISFISTFGSGRQLTMDISGYNDKFSGTGLLNAPELGQEIKTCQSLGKKVLISLGGAVGSYGFSSEADAESVAQDVWNYFGGGSSSTRPFGDAKIDGFDLDAENNVAPQLYVPFVNKLRELYATDSSKQYYVSAAPQCPYPDANVGDAIAQADLDFLFIQFYNNYCSLTSNFFNFDTWQNFASNSSPNKNVKLYVGLAGSPSAAGSGYATIDQIEAKKSAYASSPNFGGFMVWDASQANSNIVNGKTFAQQLDGILGNEHAAVPAPAPAPAPKPATSASAPAAPATPAAPVTTAAATTTASEQPAAAPTQTYVAPASNGADSAAPNYQYQEPTSTFHATSTVHSTIASTNTISDAPVRTTSAPLTRYTSNGEIYIVDYTYSTEYTTYWENACTTTVTA